MMLNHRDFIDWALNDFIRIQWKMDSLTYCVMNPMAVIGILPHTTDNDDCPDIHSLLDKHPPFPKTYTHIEPDGTIINDPIGYDEKTHTWPEMEQLLSDKDWLNYGLIDHPAFEDGIDAALQRPAFREQSHTMHSLLTNSTIEDFLDASNGS